MISVNLEASNKTDWIIYFQATAEDTGNAIDFTGASIVFNIRDQSGCQLLTATTGNGKITLPVVGTIQIQFTSSDMQMLCAGSYPVGCVYLLNSETTQLFIGSVSVYDGVAQI